MDGRLIQPESVTYDWAPPELPAKFPAISIFASGEAQYEANKSSPTQLNDGSHRWLRSNSQLMQKFSVMLWANDATARSALLAAIEDMLEPVDWMQGVRLMLPYYFGVHATYEKLSVSFLDSPDNAQKRWRLATISVNGYIPQYIPLQSIPMIRPSAQVIVDSEPV
jgi:hypothetical protein